MTAHIKKVSVLAAAAIAAAAILALAIAPAFVTSASAAITSETNNKPNQGNPQGSGNGLTTTNVNPSGSAPPGQNK